MKPTSAEYFDDATTHEFVAEQEMVFDLLQDKIYASKWTWFQEVASNARDAIRERRRTDPSWKGGRITVKTGPKTTVVDDGCGMSRDRLTKVFRAYGRSTKHNDGSQTGGFGIGAKSPLSVVDTFTIYTRSIETNEPLVVNVSKKGISIDVGDDDMPVGTRVEVRANPGDAAHVLEPEYVWQRYNSPNWVELMLANWHDVDVTLNGKELPKSRTIATGEQGGIKYEVREATHGIVGLVDGIPYYSTHVRGTPIAIDAERGSFEPSATRENLRDRESFKGWVGAVVEAELDAQLQRWQKMGPHIGALTEPVFGERRRMVVSSWLDELYRGAGELDPASEQAAVLEWLLEPERTNWATRVCTVGESGSINYDNPTVAEFCELAGKGHIFEVERAHLTAARRRWALASGIERFIITKYSVGARSIKALRPRVATSCRIGGRIVPIDEVVVATDYAGGVMTPGKSHLHNLRKAGKAVSSCEEALKRIETELRKRQQVEAGLHEKLSAVVMRDGTAVRARERDGLATWYAALLREAESTWYAALLREAEYVRTD